ncbi:MAG TPA: OAM dimerization domain-containing protein, partial [bacterium]|nr:OAM dimerization domain-containing protein [bacterium]
QMSFTLPAPASEEARVAARVLMEKMGFANVRVITMESLGTDFSFFVVYGASPITIDLREIDVPKLEYPQYSFIEINKMLPEKLGRKAIVLGACIGSDAHTVGIDAIFNMKGYLGDYGLERYSAFQAINLRSQVAIDDLVKKIIDMRADAVLISRVVTQRDEHISELKNFLLALQNAQNVPAHLIRVCGGPRITHQEALELGYDAGFGPGTKPSHVASYLATELVRRLDGKK